MRNRFLTSGCAGIRGGIREALWNPDAYPAGIPCILSKFAFKKYIAGEYWSIPAYAETPRIKTAGTADTDTALHVPMKTELPPVSYTLLCQAQEDAMHHPLGTTYAEGFIPGQIDGIHEPHHESPMAG